MLTHKSFFIDSTFKMAVNRATYKIFANYPCQTHLVRLFGVSASEKQACIFKVGLLRLKRLRFRQRSIRKN